jgi:hypothetical protein
MKVWIDKQGGTHYHKEFCPIVVNDSPLVDRLPPVQFHYENIVRQLRGNIFDGWRDIIVDGNRYSSCPICFRHSRK